MIAQKVFFVHIPKTAGSSITAVLRDHFEAAQVCPYYHYAHLNRNNLQTLPRWDFFWGHLPVSIRNYIKSPFIFTFLREPLERFFSEYHYVITHPDEIMDQNCQTWAHPLLEAYAGRAFEEVADNRSLITVRLNFQTLWLADAYFDRDRATPPDLNGAQNKASIFLGQADFVGLTERLHESLILLSDRLRIPLLEIRNSLKVNQRRPASGWITQFSDFEQNLKMMAAFDYQIYENARIRLQSEWEKFCERLGLKHADALNPIYLDKIRDYLSNHALSVNDHLRFCSTDKY